MENISLNIKNIKKEVGDKIKLVSVTKSRSVEEIKKAYDAGERDFGENKAQEFLTKIKLLPNDISWHFIGSLQRNKVRQIIEYTYLIQSVDRISLATEINKRAKNINKIQNILIQINIGEEKSKKGCYLENLDDLIRHLKSLDNIYTRGIMVIIPIGSLSENKYYFNKTKQIFDKLKKEESLNFKMETLSMGMSSDYKVAVDEGSNMIRVGQGIFGKRIY